MSQTVSASGAAAFEARLLEAPWRRLPDASAAGAAHMACDEALLEAAAAGADPVLRFYTWSPPAVSLGHFQNPDGVDLEYATRRGWDVVRRPTGGRGVLHQHEITYALALPPVVVGAAGVRTTHAVWTRLLAGGLRSFLGDRYAVPGPAAVASGGGRPANCFAAAATCDLVLVDGDLVGKVVGSAQARRRGAVLQHGAILLDAEPEAWTALFGEPGRLLPLSRLLGAAPDPLVVRAALCAALREAGVRLTDSSA